MTTKAYEAAGGDLKVAILRHRIAVAEAALGPIGRDVESDHLADFNSRLKEIAMLRAEIARIEALRDQADLNPGVQP